MSLNDRPARAFILATGLCAPEGPLALPDGSVLVSEMFAGRVSRVAEDGSVSLFKEVPGNPNGLAFGPDGHLYIANMGGTTEESAALFPCAIRESIGYGGGRIERIRVDDGLLETVCKEDEKGSPLLAPDDLVFDQDGGFYFTDIGGMGMQPDTKGITGIFYVAAAGGPARPLVESSSPTNGIGLSPDGETLWWTEYATGRLFRRRISAPGILMEAQFGNDCVYVAEERGLQFDSLTVLADSGVAIAVHTGTREGKSGILSFDVDGRIRDFASCDDLYTTHIAFGGPDLKTAYITLTGSGRLARTQWPVAGLAPRFPAPAALPSPLQPSRRS